MAKVRVYELAKELGLESKDLLKKLNDMGEFVRSASSTIEPPVVRRLNERMAAEKAGNSGAPAKGKSTPRPGVPGAGAARPRPGGSRSRARARRRPAPPRRRVVPRPRSPGRARRRPVRPRRSSVRRPPSRRNSSARPPRSSNAPRHRSSVPPPRVGSSPVPAVAPARCPVPVARRRVRCPADAASRWHGRPARCRRPSSGRSAPGQQPVLVQPGHGCPPAAPRGCGRPGTSRRPHRRSPSGRRRRRSASRPPARCARHAAAEPRDDAPAGQPGTRCPRPPGWRRWPSRLRRRPGGGGPGGRGGFGGGPGRPGGPPARWWRWSWPWWPRRLRHPGRVRSRRRPCPAGTEVEEAAQAGIRPDGSADHWRRADPFR